MEPAMVVCLLRVGNAVCAYDTGISVVICALFISILITVVRRHARHTGILEALPFQESVLQGEKVDLPSRRKSEVICKPFLMERRGGG